MQFRHLCFLRAFRNPELTNGFLLEIKSLLSLTKNGKSYGQGHFYQHILSCKCKEIFATSHPGFFSHTGEVTKAFLTVLYPNLLFILQFRHQIGRGLRKTPCCRHRSKNAGQRDDVIDKTHHQMYASTALNHHHMSNHVVNNGLSLEQALHPANSSTSGGSTSSTGTASSGDVPPGAHQNVNTNQLTLNAPLNNAAFYVNNNLRQHTTSPLPSQQMYPPPPYVNQINRFTPTTMIGHAPASLPCSVRATPTADFELYTPQPNGRLGHHLRTNSYTQATQQPAATNHIYNSVSQSTPSHRRYTPTLANGHASSSSPSSASAVVQQYQMRQLGAQGKSGSVNSILSDHPHQNVNNQLTVVNNNNNNRQLLYDKIHGRQSSSSAGRLRYKHPFRKWWRSW